MRTNKRFLTAAVMAAGVLVLAGSAFTASNTMPPDIVRGYGDQEVTGVTVTSISHNLNAIKEEVVSVDVVVVGDSTALTLEVAYNDDVPSVCGGGVYDVGDDETSYNCTTGLAAYQVADIDRFVVIASD